MVPLQKLILRVCDKAGDVRGGNTGSESPQDIELMFNPEELTFTRSVK